MTNLSHSISAQDANSAKQGKITILIVDDQAMIREGLKALIQTEQDLEVVGTAVNGEDGIKQVEVCQPDIVLMDMEMPGMDGVSATKIICEKFPDVKILVLSTFDTQEYVAKSLSSGAMGYLLKGTPAQELTNAIRSVYLGYAQIGPGVYQNLPLIPRGESGNQGAAFPLSSSGSKLGAQQLSPRLSNQISTVSNSSGESALAVSNNSALSTRKFEQTVLLRPSPKWSRYTVWGISLVTAFAIIWASVAKIEQVVPALGQLKPEGKVKEVQIPTSGVVEEVKVEEGQRVEKGDVLVVLDSTISKAQLGSLEYVRQSLAQENQFYRSLLNDKIAPNKINESLSQLQVDIPKEILFLARNRAQIKAENELLRAQLGAQSKNLTLEQKVRLKNAQAESRSRTAAARLEVEQLEKQFEQNELELADARAQLVTSNQVLKEIEQRNSEAIVQAQNSLEIEEKALASIVPLVEQGAIATLQLDRQQQQLNDRRATIIEQKARGTIEFDNQKQQAKTTQATIDRGIEESQRLRLAIAQAKEQLINNSAFSDKDVLDNIASNQQRIADIDTNLNRRVIDNDKQIQETKSQISSAKQTLNYQSIVAPVSGSIFDLAAYPGYVPPSGQAAQPILKIIPEDQLIAEVFIRPEDIGFVYQNMSTDVRITAFPFGEFGDIKGKVTFIGKDALEPERTYDFFRYPATITLDKQSINIRGEEKQLQSGMSVQANIRVNENRTVMRLLFDKFFVGLDKFKNVR